MTDYSKTIIYKIQHEDNEELLYVGSTTNFTKRKNYHKNSCINPNNTKHHLKLYKMIRENGGWDCFKFIQIKEFACSNKREAEAEEDRIMLELKANMNSNRACRDKREYDKEYYLDNIDTIKERKKEWYLENIDKIKEQHFINSEKIKEYQKEHYLKNADKLEQKIVCECNCEVVICNLTRHKKSTKHQGRILINQIF